MSILCKINETFEKKTYSTQLTKNDIKNDVSHFLKYITFSQPKNLQELMKKPREKLVINYIQTLIRFICNLYEKPIVDTLIYNELIEHLELPEIVFDEDAGYQWGPVFWTFLHKISIILPENLLEDFACLLLNFHLILFCPICYDHYKSLLPLCNVFLPILYIQDVVTIVFHLHNKINKDLNKPIFSEDEFCEKYQLKIVKREFIDLNITEVF